MMCKRARVWNFTMAALALATSLGLSAVVTASDGRAVPVEERVKGSDKVVVATAQSVEPTWRQNSHGDWLIVSRVLLRVDETLKGVPEGAVWMDLEGGTLDGFTLRVSDLPDIKPGERAVFFLDSTASGVHAPHARGQGILKLDAVDVVRGSSLRLADVRRAARAARN